MKWPFDRRQFLRSASAFGVGAGLAPSLARPAWAAPGAAAVSPEAVRFRPEIEPVVRWIEETPRERIFDVALEQLRDGLGYRDLMAGLFLAGVRNIKPRPVGFKFHAVMVINSAHMLAQTTDEGDRLMPLFWALDNFKGSQAQDVKEGDWTLSRVDESRLPSAGRAGEEFVRAMDAWDEGAADAATAAFFRNAGAAQVMEAFWLQGLRDQRNIGHKAIFTMQCWRTLQAIGWEHAEPVLRSLTFALLDLQGEGNRGPVGPYASNLERTRKIREGWTSGRPDAGATRRLLETIRTATPDEASEQAVRLLNDGIHPDSLWDAATLAAGELMMRSPGILALHAVTSANALHFAYNASGVPATRQLALLQAVGWLPLFRDRVKPPDAPALDALEPIEPEAKGDAAVAEIFDGLESDRLTAARKAMGYVARGGSADDLYAVARRMIFQKGRDSHDYKFGAAAWEEHLLAGDPRWKGPLLAASLFKTPGATASESPLMRKARESIDRVIGRKA